MVLQWSSDGSGGDLDRLIATEELLMSELPTSSKIDGHDIGSGEMNIFICTDDPLAAFVHVKAVLKHPSDWENMKAGFRKISEDEYSVLWPKELDRFEVV